MTDKPDVYVDLLHSDAPPDWDHDKARWQPYRIMVTASNGKPLFRSTERYTNRQDAFDTCVLAFGPWSTVMLREDGTNLTPLREAVDSPNDSGLKPEVKLPDAPAEAGDAGE